MVSEALAEQALVRMSFALGVKIRPARLHSPSWPDETEKPSVDIARNYTGTFDLNCDQL